MGMTPVSSTLLSNPRFGLRQVRAFVCVADELHFGRAASRLCMAQPALSRTIRNLEKALDVALFQRSTRKVQLTPAGEAFAIDCRFALNHLELAARAAQNAARGKVAKLRVAYTDIAIDGPLPEILQALRRKGSDVSIDLQYMPTSLQHIALAERRLDVGFITGDIDAKNIQKTLVDEQDFVVLLPEGHRLALQEAVRLSDLSCERFVIGSEERFGSFRRLLFDLCNTAGFFPNVVQEVSDSSGIGGLVASGAGISIYAGCVRNVLRSGMVVRGISDAYKRIPIFAAWLANHPSETLHRLLMIVNAKRYQCRPSTGPR